MPISVATEDLSSLINGIIKGNVCFVIETSSHLQNMHMRKSHGDKYKGIMFAKKPLVGLLESHNVLQRKQIYVSSLILE